MNTRNLRRGVLAALLVAGLALAFAPGAEAQLATAIHYGGGIDLHPNVSYREAVLTVSRGDMVQRTVFDAGEIPTIGLFDAEGELLADGVYTWELNLVPTRAAARALREAATFNGGEAPDAWEALTGSFAVAGGAIVGPGLPEPGARPAEAPLLVTRVGSRAAAGPGRGSQGDDDAAVGMREGVEAAMSAAVSGPRVAAPQPIDFRGAYRSDLAAQDLSAESAARPATRQASGPVPQPRSDGTNGREKDQ